MAGRTQGWSTPTTRMPLPCASIRPVTMPALGPRRPATASGTERIPPAVSRPATTTSETTCDRAAKTQSIMGRASRRVIALSFPIRRDRPPARITPKVSGRGVNRGGCAGFKDREGWLIQSQGVKQQVTEEDLSRVRRRLLYVLFTGNTLGWIGFIATLTVATVAARSLTGSTTMAGIPLAAGALGQAFGTSLFGRLSSTRGRRFIMLLGPPLSALGAAFELVGVMAGWYWVLVGGAVLVGAGLGSQHLARYVAAELADEGRRGQAMGILVLSGTIGAVVGANLVEGIGEMMEGSLGTPYAGAFVLATASFLLTWSLFGGALRPDPSKVSTVTEAGMTGGGEGTVGTALRLPSVQVAILAMVSAQVVMVSVMTATPLRIEDAGYGLDIVGIVISTHTVGMFAFAPWVGKLVDRIGYLPVLGIGLFTTLLSLLLSGIAPQDGYGMLNAGLFLLGLGWCFLFVAGSSMLFDSAPSDVRQVVEGWADSLIYVMVMTGSAGAGVLMEAIGFGLLNLVSAGFLLFIFLLVSLVRRLRVELSG